MVNLYKLLVLQKHSGLCLIDADLGDFPSNKEQNGLLISGLLTSFMHFTNEILGEEMRLFETKNFRIVFSSTEDILIAVIMSRKGPVHLAEKILERVKKRFTLQYGEEIENSLSGDVSRFSKIEKEFEEVTQLKGIKLIRHMMRKEKRIYSKEIKDTIQTIIRKSNSE